MNEALIVLSTAGSEQEARRIGQALVERQLAACVNILSGVESIYRWKGRVERSPECLMIIKTTRAGFPSLQAAILALHSYDIPEVIAFQVAEAASGYLQWLNEAIVAPSKTDL